MVTYTYKVAGEPLIFIHERDSTRMWNYYKQQRVRALIALEGQQDGKPLLAGPISMELHFNMKDPKHDLTCYVKFIEYLLVDIAYATSHQIESLTVRRSRVTQDPSTLIILTEIERE